MHWSRRCSLLICLALTLCTTAAAQISYPWISEDSSGRATVAQEDGDTLDIASPDGLTLWLDSCLRGTYTVSFRAQVLTGCDSCRLSDLNCFWAARDPEHPDDFFARSAWRQGWFDRYNTLCLFYVGLRRQRKYHHPLPPLPRRPLRKRRPAGETPLARIHRPRPSAAPPAIGTKCAYTSGTTPPPTLWTAGNCSPTN